MKTNDKLGFRVARFYGCKPNAVTIESKTVMEDGTQKVIATAKGQKIGLLMDGEHCLSMWYVV